MNGPVTRSCVKSEALKATSSQTASATLGTQAKQMTKKAGPSAGSAAGCAFRRQCQESVEQMPLPAPRTTASDARMHGRQRRKVIGHGGVLQNNNIHSMPPLNAFILKQ